MSVPQKGLVDSYTPGGYPQIEEEKLCLVV